MPSTAQNQDTAHPLKYKVGAISVALFKRVSKCLSSMYGAFKTQGIAASSIHVGKVSIGKGGNVLTGLERDISCFFQAMQCFLMTVCPLQFYAHFLQRMNNQHRIAQLLSSAVHPAERCQCFLILFILEGH